MGTSSVRWFDDFFNWQLSLSSIPLGNALLADLLLVSSVFDSPLEEPEGGFQCLNHPQSLHTNLLVLIDRGHKTFEIGQSNMKNIKMRSLLVMVDFKTLLDILKSEGNSDTDKVIQIPLANVQRTAEQWNVQSTEIVDAFYEPMCLIGELYAACRKTLIRENRTIPEGVPLETLNEEVATMKEDFSRNLAVMEQAKSKEIDADAARMNLMEYSLNILTRLERHWQKALTSLRSMADVVQKVGSAGLFEFADYVKEISRVLPLSASEVKFLLTATAKVHQICDATERMGDLYGNVTDKYVMSSFNNLGNLVVVEPDKEERDTLLLAGYRMWDHLVPSAGQEDEMIKEIDERLAQIENEYLSLSHESNVQKE